MADSGQGASGAVVVEDVGTSGERFRPGEPPHGETFDACVEDIRRWFVSGSGDVLRRLEDAIRRKLGVAPLSPVAAVLAGLTGAGVRLLAALLATALSGRWPATPWGRWWAILGFYFAMEAVWAIMTPPLDVAPPAKVRQIVEDWTAMLPTIVRESDLRELAAATRRWFRIPRTMATGAGVAGTMLLVCWLVAPGALRTLPLGSIVLLAWLLYDFGTIPVYWGNLFNRSLMAREARYDHHLFWPRPADSPEVLKVMRKTASQAFAAGGWITLFLVMAVVLVSWDSPLVLPLAVAFVAIGYLSTIGLAVGNRVSVRTIIERSRQEHLALLRRRIDAFEADLGALTPPESKRLRDLLFLYDTIRDAPTSPTRARTFWRTTAALILPTIMFVVTVFGEVSAERILDAVLP